MINNKISAITRRPLAWISGMLGMLMCATALSMAPLPAQAKAAPADDRIDNCNWNRPGVNPFMGDVVAAVDRYQDIPGVVRERLKQRMRDRNYDEFVTISRDSIKGRDNYDARISDMHFGTGRVCRQVSRAGWTAEMKERGLVYCEQGYCLLVPTICRNVSRITRGPATAQGPAGAGGGAAGAAAPAVAADGMQFDQVHNGSLAPNNSVPGTVGSGASDLPGMVSGGGFGPATGSLGGLTLFSGSPGGNGGGGGGGTGGGGGGGIPPIVLNPVPEPETWAMLLSGLAFVVVAARRKRKV